MKKLIAITLMAAMAVMTVGPALTVATNGTVGTGLTAGSTTGERPIVKAKWEMKGPSFSGDTYTGWTGGEAEDDSTAPGAQFNAPGSWGGQMNYTVCAIAYDPVGDLDNVYARIFYSDNPMHTSPSDPNDPNYDPDEIDNPTGGCGAFIHQNELFKLSKDDGIDLVCNHMQGGNYDLPVINSSLFGSSLSDFYYDVCDPVVGELPEEEAFVYCADKSITWEDPAGLYGVEVTAHDVGGPGEILYNNFEYVEYTGFQIDFDSIHYSNVEKDARSQVSGDRDWDPTSDAEPTVRNIGNTRLNMLVAQDDMEFGQTDNVWEVEYDARVGNALGDWHGLYEPFKFAGDPGDPVGIEPDYAELNEILDLSETEKMDFVVVVHKWTHGTSYDYSGIMWLDADTAAFESCTPCP